MIAFEVNGEARTVEAPAMERLLDVLRLRMGLTGTKEGCGEGECGACSVLLEGELVNSCLVPVGQVAGMRVMTIEGVASNGELHPVQASFLRHGGAQCGICTPGMTLAAVKLLEKNRRPTLNEVREGLAGNLCRCTGYMRIFEAVQKAYEGEDAADEPTHVAHGGGTRQSQGSRRKGEA